MKEVTEAKPIIRAFEYVEGDSPLHKLNPLPKLLMIFSVTALVITILEPLFSFVVSIMIWVLALIGRVHKQLTMAYKGAVAIMGVAFATYYFIAYTVYPFMVYGTFKIDGFCWAASGLYRYCNLVGIVAVFAGVTRMIDLATSLSKVKVPTKAAISTSIAFGTLPVFVSELRDIIDAYESRGLKVKHVNPIKKFKSYLDLLTPAIFGTVRKAQWMSVALECKGFGYSGERTYRVKVELRTMDYIAIAINIGIIALCAYVSSLRIPSFFISYPLFENLLETSPLALIAGFILFISFPVVNILRKPWM